MIASSSNQIKPITKSLKLKNGLNKVAGLKMNYFVKIEFQCTNNTHLEMKVIKS